MTAALDRRPRGRAVRPERTADLLRRGQEPDRLRSRTAGRDGSGGTAGPVAAREDSAATTAMTDREDHEDQNGV